MSYIKMAASSRHHPTWRRRGAPKVQFGMTLDLGMPYHRDFDKNTSQPPDKEAYALWRLGRKLFKRGLPVAIYDRYHRCKTYFATEENESSLGNYVHSYFMVLGHYIGPLDQDEPVNSFPVRLKAVLMGESNIREYYEDLNIVLRWTNLGAVERISLHPWYDMEVHISPTGGSLRTTRSEASHYSNSSIRGAGPLAPDLQTSVSLWFALPRLSSCFRSRRASK